MKGIILYGLLFLSFAFAGCVNSMEEVNALNSKSGFQEEHARDVETYYYNEDGKLKGIMTAPTLLRFMTDTPYMQLPDGLKIKFYDDSMRLQSILTAKEGFYYEKSENVTVKDSVVLITQDGKMLETDILYWDPKKDRFYTDDPVKLTTSSQVIYGKNGLIAPPDISWYQFNNASGNIKMDSTFSIE